MMPCYYSELGQKAQSSLIEYSKSDRFVVFVASTELTCQQLVTEHEQLKKKYRSIIEV
jgi:hypothetical protein